MRLPEQLSSTPSSEQSLDTSNGLKPLPLSSEHLDSEHLGTQSEADELFRKLYGVPLNWAIGMARINGPLGEHWRGVFRHINDLTPEEMTSLDPIDKP